MVRPASLLGGLFLLALLALAACGDDGPSPTPTPTATPSPAARRPSPSPEPKTPEEADPAALFQQVVDAVNSGDAAGAAALFTDDGLVELIDVISNGNVGRETLTDILRAFVGSRWTIISAEVSDDTATGRVKIEADFLRPFGVERVIDLFTVQVEDDRISFLRLQFDLTDPETADVFALLEAQPQQGGTPPDVIRMSLGPGRDADQSGIAFLGPAEDMPIGGIGIEITPGAAGVLQPIHIHSGSCDNLGPIVLPLVSVFNGKSFTHISPARMSELLEGGFAINVHKSEEERDVFVACGNIGEPLALAPGQEPLPLTFAEVDGSGIGGTVTITALADGRLLVAVEATGLRAGATYISGVYDQTSVTCRGGQVGSFSGWFNTEYPSVSYFIPGPLDNAFSVSIRELDDGPPGVVRACAERTTPTD